IRDGDTVLGSTTADKSGNWRFTPDAAHALSEGTHSLTAQSKDAAGAQSAPSQSYELNIDTTPPVKPSIEEVIDNAGDVTGALHPHDTTDDAQPTLKGTAEQNSIVMIYDVVNGTKVLLGSTQADAAGRWSFRPDAPLENGHHALSVVAHDAAGNESEPSNGFEFSVLTGVPTAPAITGVYDAVEPHIGNVEKFGATNDARPTVNGTAQPGQIVHIYVDGKDVGT
ncbi:Ig-like domain-containing protein, partial [Burkholderia orbicola]